MSISGNWDGRISRRTLLRTGGSAAAGIVLLGHAATARAIPPFTGHPFSLGVASGDPTPDGIVLWTRLAPAPLEGGGLPPQSFGVRYEVAADEGFRRIVRRGSVDALPEEAHTVHAEIAGLQPATEYWYRFKWGTAVSRKGRTRTAPALGTTPEALQFAFVSCQNYSHGFYPAYGDIADQKQLELVVHLGDYIYEGSGLGPGNPGIRTHVPARELLSLADYRTRHAQYKTDPDLQEAHATHPFLMTWDDHEFKDNYANLDLDPNQPLADVSERRAAAYLAYWEHSPLSRSRKPVGKDMSLYRRARWGELATFHVLDTRQYRSDQMETQCTQAQRDVSSYCPVQLDPTRSLLGAEQRDWLFEGIAAAPASGWNILANQVGFAPQANFVSDRRRFNADSWDGYVADRQRVLDFLKQNEIKNTVVITGDKHQNSVRNVPESYTDIAGPAVATEFVGTSISSEGDTPDKTTYGGDPNNPHILFENFQRGYVRVTLEPERWTNDFRVVGTVSQSENVPTTTLATFVVDHGVPGATRAESVVSPV